MRKSFFIKLMKICVSICLCVAISVCGISPVFAQQNMVAPVAENLQPNLGFEVECQSAVLMEASTGQILYAKNPDVALPPASVTKIMTLLLVMEAVAHGHLKMTDMVTASAHAASMGGSQIFLKEGESMTAEDMIKSVVISSANDAAVALAEHVAGSESAFVEQMNQKAQALGMKNTHFENTNGLDDTAQNHVTSAQDIAIMSRALISHEDILKYSSIWMDTIRNGEFGLTNTNRLVRFYKGCNGLKTGSTQKAGFCISATAERDGMTLICVIMGAESRDIRNAIATKLLDWGFANYGRYTYPAATLPDMKVSGGESAYIPIFHETYACILPKNQISSVEVKIELPQTLQAPVYQNENVGTIKFYVNGKEIGTLAIQAGKTSEKIGFWQLFLRMFEQFLLF